MKTKVITELHDLSFEVEVNMHLKDGYEVQGFSHTRDDQGDSWYSCLLVKDDDND